MPDLAPLSLGPVVLSGERALVALALIAFLLSAEILARRRGHDVEWAWTSVLIGLAAARIGWIVAHPQAYLARPAEVLFVWQGGFLAWAGIAGGLLWAIWRTRRGTIAPSSLALPVVLAGAVSALALLALPAEPERPALATMNVSVRTLDGTEEPVAAWEGRPAVVNLWATWCPPCRRELPMLVEVVGGRDDVRLALVSQGEPAAVVDAYLREEGLPAGDVWLDPPRGLGAAISLSGYPTTLFVDADGEVREVAVGELSRARLLRGMAAVGVPARPAGAP